MQLMLNDSTELVLNISTETCILEFIIVLLFTHLYVSF